MCSNILKYTTIENDFIRPSATKRPSRLKLKCSLSKLSDFPGQDQDHNGALHEDVLMQDLHISGPLDLKLLEQYKDKIVKDIGEKGFTDEFEYDSESFLTNPQTVYAAARVYEQVDAGDKQATDILRRMDEPDSRNKIYHQLINKLSARTNENISTLTQSPMTLLSLAWEFLKHPTALVSLYRDYKFPVKEENSNLVAVESQLRDIEVAIRKLSDNKNYIYIGSGTPAIMYCLAISIAYTKPLHAALISKAGIGLFMFSAC